jgi:F-type H+-transporting ATPase subunit alpha
MKKVSGSLKLLYSQYRELQSFAQFGSDLDADTKARLDLGERIVEVLKQKNNEPVDVAHQVCIIYAVVNGYLKSIAVKDIHEFEKQFFAYMDENYGEALDSIRTEGSLGDDVETAIKAALTEMTSKFVSAN